MSTVTVSNLPQQRTIHDALNPRVPSWTSPYFAYSAARVRDELYEMLKAEAQWVPVIAPGAVSSAVKFAATPKDFWDPAPPWNPSVGSKYHYDYNRLGAHEVLLQFERSILEMRLESIGQATKKHVQPLLCLLRDDWEVLSEGSASFHSVERIGFGILTLNRGQTRGTSLVLSPSFWEDDLATQTPNVQRPTTPPTNSPGVWWSMWQDFAIARPFMAPDELLYNGNNYERNHDQAGTPIPDCADDDLVVGDHEPGLPYDGAEPGDTVTTGLTDAWIGFKADDFPKNFYDGASISVSKVQSEDPDVLQPETGAVRLWITGDSPPPGQAEREVYMFDPSNPAAGNGSNLAPTLKSIYSNPAANIGYHYWIEGTKPGKVTLMYFIQRPAAGDNAPSINTSFKQTFDVVLPAEIVAHPLLANGNIGADETEVQLSTPAPIVDLQQCSLINVSTDADGNLVGDLSLSGSITSEVCDTLPGSRGSITSAKLYVNGASDAVATIPVAVSKQSNGPVARQYPYSGTFSQVVQGVPLVQGLNNFKVSAQDLVYAMPGYSTWSANVRLSEPPEDGAPAAPLPSGLHLSLALPVAGLNSGQPDQVSVSWFYECGATTTALLTETGAQTSTFAGLAGLQPVTLALEGSDSFSAVARDSASLSFQVGGTSSAAVQIRTRETAPASLVFVGGFFVQILPSPPQPQSSSASGQNGGGGTQTASSPPVTTATVDYPTPSAQTNGGEFYAYALEFKIPGGFNPSLPEVKVQIEGQNFDVKRDETTKKLLLQRSDGEKPAIFSFRISERGLAVELDSDKVVANLEREGASFAKGFAVGMGVGGADLITGGATLALTPLTQTYKMVLGATLGFTWAGQAALGRDTSGTKRAIAAVSNSYMQEDIQKANAAKALFGLLLSLEQSGLEFDQAVLKMLVAGLEGASLDEIGKLGSESESMLKVATFCAETIPQMWHDMGNASSAKKGFYTGRVVFEILTIIVPEAKLGNLSKLTKAKALAALAEGPTLRKLPAATSAMVRNLAARLLETKMCFLAGTKIHTKLGLRNIEDVGAGTLVWSRNEFSGEEGWMPVIDTFITHPAEIYHLAYTVRGPPLPGSTCPRRTETLGVTAPHPFWVLNRAKPSWVPAAELRCGDELSLADGGTAEVQTRTHEAKADGGAFTTYNFEVARFHTYFAGGPGVWVHNSTPTPCERVFSIFNALFEKYSGDVWKAWGLTSGKIAGLKDSNLLRVKLANEARAKYFNGLPNGTHGPWLNTQGQKIGVGANVKNNPLNANLEKVWRAKKPFNMHGHHIVEKLDNPEVANILEEAGIDIHEAANGTWMKSIAQESEYAKVGKSDWLEGLGPRHSTSHSPAYTDAVIARIGPLRGQPGDVVRDELQRIAKELIEGNFPWPR